MSPKSLICIIFLLASQLKIAKTANPHRNAVWAHPERAVAAAPRDIGRELSKGARDMTKHAKSWVFLNRGDCEVTRPLCQTASPPLDGQKSPNAAAMPELVYQPGDCRPDDLYDVCDRIRQKRSLQAVEFVIVGGALDIRFGTREDAAYAHAHLRILYPSTKFKIAVRAS
jgi:hypothetical protein